MRHHASRFGKAITWWGSNCMAAGWTCKRCCAASCTKLRFGHDPLQRLAGIAAKAHDLLDQDTDDSLYCLFRRWLPGFGLRPRTPSCVLWCELTARKLQVAPFARRRCSNRAGHEYRHGAEQDSMARQASALTQWQRTLIQERPERSVDILLARAGRPGCSGHRAGTTPRARGLACEPVGAAHPCIWPTVLWPRWRHGARGAIVAQAAEIHGGGNRPGLTSVWARPWPRPPASTRRAPMCCWPMAKPPCRCSVAERANTPWVISVLDKHGVAISRLECKADHPAHHPGRGHGGSRESHLPVERCARPASAFLGRKAKRMAKRQNRIRLPGLRRHQPKWLGASARIAVPGNLAGIRGRARGRRGQSTALPPGAHQRGGQAGRHRGHGSGAPHWSGRTGPGDGRWRGRGAVVLIGGDPGIGKSTLLLQALDALQRWGRTPFTSPARKAALRWAARATPGAGGQPGAGAGRDPAEKIQAALQAHAPQVAVIDSIQTVYSRPAHLRPGSVAQVPRMRRPLTRSAKGPAAAPSCWWAMSQEGALARAARAGAHG